MTAIQAVRDSIAKYIRTTAVMIYMLLRDCLSIRGAFELVVATALVTTSPYLAAVVVLAPTTAAISMEWVKVVATPVLLGGTLLLCLPGIGQLAILLVLASIHRANNEVIEGFAGLKRKPETVATVTA